ncbi:MAG: polyphenol oxidase family protein [Verrucomicrobiota bacterium]
MSAGQIPVETFPVLSAVPGLRHGFSRRTAYDTRADEFAGQFARQLGFNHFAGAEQTHGNTVAIVDRPGIYPGVDALITGHSNLPLIIRCADCAPVFIVDQKTPAIALIHSGKKGTLANVVGATLQHLNAADCLAFIGPCIGPCHYEMDLWSAIETQLREAGIGEIHSPRICTACHLDRYYSYRAEHGQTGRMFAALALKPIP